MIHVWTDGACKGNPGRGGAGVVILLPDGTKGRLGRPLGQTTNNRAELLAVRIAFAALAAHTAEPIRIHTDSQNVMGWLTGAFRVNTNADLVAEIRQCLRAFSSVSFEKVRGHCGDPGNEEADRLAQRAAAGVTVSEWSSSADPLGPLALLHLELGSFLAKVRQLGGAIQVMLSEGSCYSGPGAEIRKMGGRGKDYGPARSMSPMWINMV